MKPTPLLITLLLLSTSWSQLGPITVNAKKGFFSSIASSLGFGGNTCCRDYTVRCLNSGDFGLLKHRCLDCSKARRYTKWLFFTAYECNVRKCPGGCSKCPPICKERRKGVVPQDSWVFESPLAFELKNKEFLFWVLLVDFTWILNQNESKRKLDLFCGFRFQWLTRKLFYNFEMDSLQTQRKTGLSSVSKPLIIQQFSYYLLDKKGKGRGKGKLNHMME